MTALVIFLLTFVGVALTGLPRVKVDRPAAAFTGAVAMALFGVLSPAEAVAAIDWDTIGLLLGMMIIIAGLQRDGYTQRLATLALGQATSPFRLLVIVVAFTGVASAFLVNDAVVLVFTPILIAHCRTQRLDPIPFLLAEAMASNIGGVATITGNPQNVLIGLQSGISYSGFLARLLPVAVLSALVLIGATALLCRRQLRPALPSPKGKASPPSLPDNDTLAIRELEQATSAVSSEIGLASGGLRHRWRRLNIRPSVIVLALVIAGFLSSGWTDLQPPLVALTGASLIIITNPANPRAIFVQVDWVLLLFFAALFVVIGGAVREGLLDWAIESVTISNDLAGMSALHGISLALSQIISNVPYTVLMMPTLQAQGTDLLWLTLATGATLAGNLTLLGAVANLIVAERANEEGISINLWEFFKLGLPVTLLTMLLSLGVLWAEQRLGLLS